MLCLLAVAETVGYDYVDVLGSYAFLNYVEPGGEGLLVFRNPAMLHRKLKEEFSLSTTFFNPYGLGLLLGGKVSVAVKIDRNTFSGAYFSYFGATNKNLYRVDYREMSFGMVFSYRNFALNGCYNKRSGDYEGSLLHGRVMWHGLLSGGKGGVCDSNCLEATLVGSFFYSTFGDLFLEPDVVLSYISKNVYIGLSGGYKISKPSFLNASFALAYNVEPLGIGVFANYKSSSQDSYIVGLFVSLGKKGVGMVGFSYGMTPLGGNQSLSLSATEAIFDYLSSGAPSGDMRGEDFGF